MKNQRFFPRKSHVVTIMFLNPVTLGIISTPPKVWLPYRDSEYPSFREQPQSSKSYQIQLLAPRLSHSNTVSFSYL